MRTVLVAVVAVVLLTTTAACSDDEGGQEVHEFVVPAGTADRIEAGETVSIMPAELEFRVGDTIRIRNEDDADQPVGPYFVAAGTEFELEYGAPGRYEGYCALAEGQRYEIVITE